MEQIFHPAKPLMVHRTRFHLSRFHRLAEEQRQLQSNVLAQFERVRLVRKLFSGLEKSPQVESDQKWVGNRRRTGGTCEGLGFAAF